MTTYGRKPSVRVATEERCDTRVWSGECEQTDFSTGSSDYLCVSCGTIRNLDHEVHHEAFPHVSGDTDNLS